MIAEWPLGCDTTYLFRSITAPFIKSVGFYVMKVGPVNLVGYEMINLRVTSTTRMFIIPVSSSRALPQVL